MTDAAPLRLVEEEGPQDEAAEPKVFARSISVPPGAPWDQARAARLEARAGAPLPLAEVDYQLHRMSPWSPGRPAKFAAFYVRSRDVGQRLRAEAVVDDRRMEVVFASRAERERRARRVGLIAVGAAASVALLLASGLVAVSARRGAEAQLQDLERVADTKARLARRTETEHRQALALNAAGMRGRGLAAWLADLDWASSAKVPEARISAVHWDRGAMMVEARGDAAPFVDAGRTVTKMDKALRPGVWLWGVTRGGWGARIVAPTAPAADAEAP